MGGVSSGPDEAGLRSRDRPPHPKGRPWHARGSSPGMGCVSGWSPWKSVSAARRTDGGSRGADALRRPRPPPLRAPRSPSPEPLTAFRAPQSLWSSWPGPRRGRPLLPHPPPTPSHPPLTRPPPRRRRPARQIPGPRPRHRPREEPGPRVTPRGRAPCAHASCSPARARARARPAGRRGGTTGSPRRWGRVGSWTRRARRECRRGSAGSLRRAC